MEEKEVELKVTVPCTNHHICACLLEELEELRAEIERKTEAFYEGAFIYRDIDERLRSK